MLILHANIKTMDGREFPDGYVTFENGVITAVGDAADAPAATDILDAKGQLLLPGFIDPHCHIGMWEDSLGFEGDDGNEETDPLTPQLRAIDAVNPFDRCFSEAVSFGITTVVTGPGSANPIGGQWIAMKTVGKQIDRMVVKSPVGMKFALGENPKSAYHAKSQTPATRMATAALIREQLEKARRYMEDNARAEEDPDFDRPEYDAKCEALIPVLNRQVKAYFHAHRADDICTAIRLAKEFHLDYLLIHATEGHLISEVLQQEKAALIIGPIICDRSKPELRNQTPALAGTLAKHQIPFALCTDHPVIPIQYLATGATVAVAEGLTYETALNAITINAAKLCGIDQRVGSITVGKDADLLLFDSDPLAGYQKPTAVFVNGKQILPCTTDCQGGN